jgi:hypothetical protein
MKNKIQKYEQLGDQLPITIRMKYEWLFIRYSIAQMFPKHSHWR